MSSSLRLFGNDFAEYLHGQIFAPESISRYFCSCSIPLSSEHIIYNNFSSYQRPCQYLDEFFNLSDIRTSCCLLTSNAEPLNPLNHNMPYTPSTVSSPNACCNVLYVCQALPSNVSKKNVLQSVLFQRRITKVSTNGQTMSIKRLQVELNPDDCSFETTAK